ncbi:MAG: nitroreductase family protein [Pseudomonadota bacterium]
MDVYDAIERRRTIRKLKGPATQEQLLRIIGAATKSPSSGNKQNWEFIIVDDPEVMKKVSEIKYILNRGRPLGEQVTEKEEKAAQRQRNSFFDASLVMVYHNQKLADAAGVWCCIQNMLLAAVAEGLGTRIARFRGQAVNDINTLMHAPEGMELVAAISIGISAEEPGPRKLRPEGSWLHRNRF